MNLVDHVALGMYGDLEVEYAVIDDGALEVWPSEESARAQMRDFYSDDARLVSRVVSEWVDD